MGFFGEVWNYLKEKMPSVSDLSIIPTSEEAKSWHYWFWPVIITAGVVMIGVEYTTGFFSGLWDDFWWWLHYWLGSFFGSK